jgi:hypothetical protein
LVQKNAKLQKHMFDNLKIALSNKNRRFSSNCVFVLSIFGLSPGFLVQCGLYPVSVSVFLVSGFMVQILGFWVLGSGRQCPVSGLCVSVCCFWVLGFWVLVVSVRFLVSVSLCAASGFWVLHPGCSYLLVSWFLSIWFLVLDPGFWSLSSFLF